MLVLQIPFPLAVGFTSLLFGLLAVGLGIFALIRGGRGQGRRLLGIPERWFHVLASVWLLGGGAAGIVFGTTVVWSYLSA